MIPCSALSSGTAPRVLQFGHSLLATRSEVMTGSWLRFHAHNTSSVLFAIDWAGMSTFDLPVIARSVCRQLLYCDKCQITADHCEHVCSYLDLKSSLIMHALTCQNGCSGFFRTSLACRCSFPSLFMTSCSHIRYCEKMFHQFHQTARDKKCEEVTPF
jgi:hypothetical protein